MATWVERHRRRPGLWALIAAMHLALLLPPWLRQHQGAPAEGSRIELRLLAARPAPALVEVSQAKPALAPAARPAKPLALQTDAAAPSTQASTEPVPEPAAEATAAPTAERPAQQPLLINTEATRRAVLMMAAGQPLLSERAQAATGLAPRETDQARLGREIQAAATKDCLKGEFLGASLGPYSLPFWLLAEARGKCRR